jgi:tRNA uridine 5-carboxymethylaminomethyl modification enzyme
MFTSRAEHRLLFNHGSAELRLCHHADKYGLISRTRLARVVRKKSQIEEWVKTFESKRSPVGQGTWGDAIRRSTTGGGATPIYPEAFVALPPTSQEEVLYRVSYQGYLAREQRQIEKMSDIEKIRIPSTLDFLSVRGLRRESALKLQEFKPYTVGQASRISGVNPADINILMVVIEAGHRAALFSSQSRPSKTTGSSKTDIPPDPH